MSSSDVILYTSEQVNCMDVWQSSPALDLGQLPDTVRIMLHLATLTTLFVFVN